MPSSAVVVVACLGATYAFLWALAYLNQQPNEPPPIAGSIPFISPLVGLITEKESYYSRIRQVVFPSPRARAFDAWQTRIH